AGDHERVSSRPTDRRGARTTRPVASTSRAPSSQAVFAPGFTVARRGQWARAETRRLSRLDPDAVLVATGRPAQSDLAPCDPHFSSAYVSTIQSSSTCASLGVPLLTGNMSCGQAENTTIVSISARKTTYWPGCETVGRYWMPRPATYCVF